MTKAQLKALNKLRDNGGWMLLSGIGCQWRVVEALVRAGLVESNTVAGKSEYRFKNAKEKL